MSLRDSERAHQVIPAGDGQGERGVAAPQQAAIGFVGEEEVDDIPGVLRGKGRGQQVKRPKSQVPEHLAWIINSDILKPTSISSSPAPCLAQRALNSR